MLYCKVVLGTVCCTWHLGAANMI